MADRLQTNKHPSVLFQTVGQLTQVVLLKEYHDGNDKKIKKNTVLWIVKTENSTETLYCAYHSKKWLSLGVSQLFNWKDTSAASKI